MLRFSDDHEKDIRALEGAKTNTVVLGSRSAVVPLAPEHKPASAHTVKGGPARGAPHLGLFRNPGVGL